LHNFNNLKHLKLRSESIVCYNYLTFFKSLKTFEICLDDLDVTTPKVSNPKDFKYTVKFPKTKCGVSDILKFAPDEKILNRRRHQRINHGRRLDH